MGGRAPGYRLSRDHFQTVKRMLFPDWAQKMLCIIVPNRLTVSPEIFSWVRTRRLYLATVARFVHQAFLTRSEGTTDESKNVGCYQQEQLNLRWENSVSDGSQCIVNNRKFKMKRRRESKKSNSLTRQNNNFARASRFFCIFLGRHCTTTTWKCLIWRFVNGVNKQWQNFLSLYELEYGW